MASPLSNTAMIYRDGSAFPGGLIPATSTSTLKAFTWAANYPEASENKTCVTIMEKTKFGNNDCGGFSNSSSAVNLAYVCEARPFTTEKFGPNPGRSCYFPFKLEVGGEWQHSCIYDKKDNGADHVWCATSVDDNGVMIQEEVGDCVDERNTVYAGPGKKRYKYGLVLMRLKFIFIVLEKEKV